MKLKEHKIYDVESGRVIGWTKPAKPKSVKKVLDADIEGHDGRSNWMWIRLVNGDLILGVFPQGDLYFEVEEDHNI